MTIESPTTKGTSTTHPRLREHHTKCERKIVSSMDPQSAVKKRKKTLSSGHERNRTSQNLQKLWLHAHDIQKTKLANIPECRRL